MKKSYNAPEVILICYTAAEEMAAGVGSAMSGDDVTVDIPGGNPEGGF